MGFIASRKARVARQITVPIRQQDGFPLERRLLAPLEATTDDHETRLAAAEAALTQAEADIDQLEMDVAALEARVTALEGLHQVLTSDPATPADDDWWLVRTGTTPGSLVQVKARINGTTYVIAGIAI